MKSIDEIQLLKDKIKLMQENLMSELIGNDEEYFKKRIKKSYFDDEFFIFAVRYGMFVGLKTIQAVEKITPERMKKIKARKGAW